MYPIIKFNGWAPPAKISVWKITRRDLDSPATVRNKAGYMRRTRIRGGDSSVHTISLTLSGLTTAEMEAVIPYIEDVSFQVDYWSGGWKKGTFYCGDRSETCEKIAGGMDSWELSFELTEY